ncbi:MAG: CDP-diacylglycerol--serine O-phosphatidyltransferase [Reyranellaceae bacterium]
MVVPPPFPRRRKLPPLSINRLLPNILTLLALCAGLTAMRYGLQDRFQAAVTAVIIAGILDGLDGRLARRLGSTSRFGAELDSLSDFISFGVAPAMLIYMWTMNGAGSIGWALVLLFPVCSALRLARFNTGLDADSMPPVWMAGYFTGVPAPAGALLVLLPMMLSFEAGDAFAEFMAHPVLVGIVMAAVSALMVSRIPTYSFKRMRIPAGYVLPVMILVCGAAALLVTAPWHAFPVLALIYAATFPFSFRAAMRAKRAAANDDATRAAGEGAAAGGTEAAADAGDRNSA